MARHLYHFAWLILGWWFVSGLAGRSGAVPLEQARLTGIANQVYLLVPGYAPRRAALGANVGEGSIVKTGRNSHAELTFADQTVVRLAANTVFNFTDGAHDLNLIAGALLIESPKMATSGKVRAGEIAAATAGTTAILEHYPGVCKFLVLEGTGRLYRPAHLGDSVLVGPGQMVIGNPSEPVSDPADFDIGRFVRTSHFLVDLPALRSQGLIATEVRKQQSEKMSKTLIETNLVIYGGGTQVSLVNPVAIDSSSGKKSSSQLKRQQETRPKRPVSRHRKST